VCGHYGKVAGARAKRVSFGAVWEL
jgi:hypothetical protein